MKAGAASQLRLGQASTFVVEEVDAPRRAFPGDLVPRAQVPVLERQLPAEQLRHGGDDGQPHPPSPRRLTFSPIFCASQTRVVASARSSMRWAMWGLRGLEQFPDRTGFGTL